MIRHLLTGREFDRAALEKLIETTASLKAGRGKANQPRPLEGKSIGMIFAKSSTRTRVSFEVGIHELGGQPITKQGRYCRLTDGTIAGSVSNLMDCLRTAVLEMGIPLTEAVACATSNPARALGILDDYGTLEPGKYADVVLLSPDLKVLQVVKHGILL